MGGGRGGLLVLLPPNPAGAPPALSYLTEQNSHKFFSVHPKLSGSERHLCLRRRRAPSPAAPRTPAAPRASRSPSRVCVDVDLPQVRSPPFIISPLCPAELKKNRPDSP